MSHSFNKLWIHAIWATKQRQPLIKLNIEKQVHDFMRKEFTDIGCPVRIINGMPDHVHCLFLLNPQKAIIEVTKQVKGGTSHWLNEKNIISERFSWQTGYAAYSVSESQLEKVFHYIKNQKQHHTAKTFQQEYDEFISLHNIG